MKTLILTIYILILLSCSNSTHKKANTSCNNRINIPELGIGFCLPDSNWKVEKSPVVRIFTKEGDAVYKGIIALAIKMDLFSQNWDSERYRDEQLNEYLTNSKLTVELISKGSEIIDGRTFYYSEIKMKMKRDEKELAMYSYTMFFIDNKIGYSLDAVVLDQDYKLFNKDKILSIWQTFNIQGNPDLKEITRKIE